MSKIIIYDFDGTLTPYTLPHFEILQKCGYAKGLDDEKFQRIVTNKIKKGISSYKASYDTYFEVLKENNIDLNYENIILGSKKIKYNKGVKSYLKYLSSKNVKNYLLSSGIFEYLDNISLKDYFTKIYATTLHFSCGKAIGIKKLMTDEEKVKVVEDIVKINRLTNCKDIIYIGDGLTDYKAMKYVKENQGISILVYHDLKKCPNRKMEEVITKSFKADFRIYKPLFKYIKSLL